MVVKYQIISVLYQCGSLEGNKQKVNIYLFFLLSLAKGLSILFIFSKNQLLFIFSTVFLASISFIGLPVWLSR